MKKRPAIFLDRDGTINEERGYINHPTRLILQPGAIEAVKLINDMGFLAIIITNQAGIARGYYTLDTLNKIHNKLIGEMKDGGAKIDALYFCPHHPDGVIEKYAIRCECRKPKPGMINKALEEFQIDMDNSFMIGDRYKDVLFGNKLNLKTILVLTGYGIGEWENDREKWELSPDYVARDILDAVHWIKKEYSK
ncbi:D-glycero-beta-D-manno-heptose 1,7-bisphosphate 7-phosphatase [Candidatus Dependentiae bacterium]|nr:D-glycero-beta-D-manno-heptose 1,7-bisphosphate 7-phosphatase [Candidatus Dependentiae bacterium]